MGVHGLQLNLKRFQRMRNKLLILVVVLAATNGRMEDEDERLTGQLQQFELYLSAAEGFKGTIEGVEERRGRRTL